MKFIWIILGLGAVVILALYFKRRNSVWGGLTGGIITGILISVFSNLDWYLIAKAAIIGTFIGLGAELLGKGSDKLSPEKELKRAFEWADSHPNIQKEFDEILKNNDEYDGNIKAQQLLLEKYRKRCE